jgi:IS605 OrfB family transposase
MIPHKVYKRQLSAIIMMQRATISLKISFSTELVETMKEFSQATKFACDYAAKNKISSWKTLHQKIYYEIRRFSKLPSQLCCKAIKFAIEARRACRYRKINFNKELSIQYDQRSYSFDFSGKCSLSTIKGRQKHVIPIPKYYLDTYKDWDICGATLSKRGKDMFLNVTVTKDIKCQTSPTPKILGIDLGINNLATTSDAKFFKGVKHHIAKFQRLRAKLQSKGTKSAKKHLKRISGRQRQFMRSLNHEISKSIVSRMQAGDIIVVEDLHSIKRDKGRNMNRLLSNWSFFQLRQFVEYKATRRAILFVTVSPEYTSKTCSRCHEINSIRPNNAGFFKCMNCGYSCNADLNASYNLRGRVNAVRNTLGLFVNQPIVLSPAGDGHRFAKSKPRVAGFSSDKPTALAVGD